MYSLSRKVFFVAMVLPAILSATLAVEAQNTTPPPQQPAQTSGATSVQARIKARREQRRTAAINEVYSHLYEVYGGAGYLRFTPGPGVGAKGLQKLNEYSYDVGFTRYFSEKLGVTIDGRGMYGTAYIGNNQYNVNHPSISEYAALGGPTYRFILHPKYSISGRVLGGVAIGNFSGDTDGFGTAILGLYPDGAGAAVSASVPFEYNVSPNLGVRVAPEYFMTTFGSTIQNNLGFTAGVVYRFGKQ